MHEDEIKIIALTPSEGKHIKNINTGDIYEGVIYLGKNDNSSNYVEVSEEEYQTFIHKGE